MEKKKVFCIVFALLTMIYLIAGCSSSSQATTKQDEEKQFMEQLKISLESFAKSHNVYDAIPMPFEDFNNNFTIKLQSKYEGKNIVFNSFVSDIYYENGKNYIVLNQWLDNCVLILECSDKLIENLLNSGLTYDSFGFGNEEVVVLANIESITRLHFEVSASGTSQEGYELYLSNNNVTEIKGKCLGIEITNDSK